MGFVGAREGWVAAGLLGVLAAYSQCLVPVWYAFHWVGRVVCDIVNGR